MQITKYHNGVIMTSASGRKKQQI